LGNELPLRASTKSNDNWEDEETSVAPQATPAGHSAMLQSASCFECMECIADLVRQCYRRSSKTCGVREGRVSTSSHGASILPDRDLRLHSFRAHRAPLPASWKFQTALMRFDQARGGLFFPIPRGISVSGARVGTARAAWSIKLRYRIFDPQIHVGRRYKGSKSNKVRRKGQIVLLRELSDISQPETMCSLPLLQTAKTFPAAYLHALSSMEEPSLSSANRGEEKAEGVALT